ncbi:uncharacterized protein si:ch211-157b11.14 isoform X2 [Kryptolebias marmoratus]|uniref:uncharacterized protein si:ch211-157b11.14 isoform X2 n=1 Tax=Kryptolebias marmoratus TaxID=37003 RepID=UPI0007F93FEE|nr:uncharacterized protein si:ch211-157b11.14 isoform X2 [Kryptolebias marmoratus]
MDDFDHSIRIAENDWSSFCDESEECDLLWPSLACLDDSDLSDSGDPDQQETQRSPDGNSYTKLPERSNQSGAQGPEDDAAMSPKQGEMCVHGPGRNAITQETEREITEEIRGSDTNTPHKEPQNEQAKTLTQDGDVQTASDLRSAGETDLLSYSRAGLSEPEAAEGAEKERWFVTVNDNVARWRGRYTSGKKKRKPKKAHEGGHHGLLHGVLGRPEGSGGAKTNDNHQESEQGRARESNQSVGLRQYPSDEMKVDLAHTVKSLNRVPEDDDELLSVPSCDSEGRLSAAESVQEAQHRLQKGLHFQCSLSLTRDGVAENTGTRRAHGGQVSPQSAAAANCDCPSIVSPPRQTAAGMPGDSSTCEDDTRPDLSEARTVANSTSASACSQEDQLSPDLPLPADSPETYTQAAGQTKPVYAISAYWDEMKKLTINDILQVRNGSCSPSEPEQENAMPNPLNLRPPVDAADCSLSDSSLMDTSDAADSDYFTQPEESRSDCRSCKLLTSDFEEDYWHFVGASSDLSHEDDSSSSEGRETPVPIEDISGQCFDHQETQTLTLWPRKMYNVQPFNTEDLSILPLLSHGKSGLSPSRHRCLNPTYFLSHTDLLDAHHQMSFPEVVECFLTGSEANTESGSVIVYNPEEIFVARDLNSALASSFSPQASVEQPVPIFSCSNPTIREELPFPKQHRVFLRANWERDEEISPIRVVSHSLIGADPRESSAAAAAADVSGAHRWKGWLPIRKIHFLDKGGFCCRGSGVWVFPADGEEIQIRRENPTVRALGEGKVGPDSSQVFRRLEEQRETMWRTAFLFYL